METWVTKGIFSWFSRVKTYCIISCRRSSAVDLSHTIYGSGSLTPIIIIHGLFGSKANWRSNSSRLSESTKRPVIAVDARNHGDSPFANSHSYLDLAADVNKLMQTLNLKEATILGHSMGGRTAMVLALTEPSKVASLIVVDISPVSSPSMLTDYMPRLMDVMMSVDFEGKDIPKAKEAAKNTLTTSGLVDSPAMMNFLLMSIGLRDGKIGWKFNVNVLKQYFFSSIATFPSEMTGKVFHGPALFIAGQESHYLPQKDLQGITKLFPQASLVYVADAGHNVHMEKTEIFLNLVNKFISEYSLK